MNYRINKKNNDKLSILGFGCMRFSKSEEEVEEQIMYAIENGVNYFDTAYIYPNSEATLGRILKKNNLREKVFIATKLPHYFVKTNDDLDKIFNEELKRLQTDYIDYYFIHMLTDVNVWNRLIDLGIIQWIEEKKKLGQIKNIGFSYHGGREEFKKLVDIFEWEFCMIQYNYYDEYNQAGREGLEYAYKKGLPIMIMEPLRGGKLVNNLPEAAIKEFQKNNQAKSPAEWALRWIWNHSEVTTVLSGMNSLDMVKENIRVASTSKEKELNEDDLKMFSKVKKIMDEKIKVPCTACNYCIPCPVGVDIPTCFACYNNIEVEGRLSSIRLYLMQTTMKKEGSYASLCIECGKCEKKCPQGIGIIKELKNVKKSLESFHHKPTRYILKKFMKLN